jgi:hypothetical protein
LKALQQTLKKAKYTTHLIFVKFHNSELELCNVKYTQATAQVQQGGSGLHEDHQVYVHVSIA